MNPVRQIQGDREKTIYLTFDDGPDPRSTERVLKILDSNQASASFFVIAKNALKNRQLLDSILAAGHGIGNHSLDHRYRNFFKGRNAMLNWIQGSEDILTGLLGQSTIGFRPPAGIRTPELHWALRKLEMPLILWRIRFFDSVLKWSPKKALLSLDKTEPGSIIILHDRQPETKLPLFLQTLEIYLQEAKRRGFRFRALSREVCAQVQGN